MNARKILLTFCTLGVMVSVGNCQKKKNVENTPQTPQAPAANDVDFWLTKADQTALLKKQSTVIAFKAATNSFASIEVDSTVTYQAVDGFGYTLTGGSATLINKLPSAQKQSLLQELFGKNENSVGISYLRISIAASDLSAEVFSYDDMPAGQTDVALSNFNLSKDTVDLIPLLKEILAISPGIKILGSPWSPPVWMKDNGSSIGGSLQPQYYGVYAQYFIKYIEAMKTHGITIDAITPQNEPQHGGNNPSMVMSAEQQAALIKGHLGPAFASAGLTTKIIVWDHNCDNPQYPITILNDADAKKYVDGSAFHLYAGSIEALSTVHASHPDKNVYFTEQWTGSNESFEGNFKWHIRNVMIGSMRNWSRIALEWNLANDGNFNPHTPGGCTQCKGALTIDGAVNRNVSYYIVAQVSKFVPPGSVRIKSTVISELQSVAFETPAGKKVLVALNDGAGDITFNIKYKGKWAATTLPANSAGTYIW